MKQVSHPPFLGIVDDKKWCPFSIRASEDPFFCTQKRPFSVIKGAKKRVLGRPNKKTETTFCRQLHPKLVDETLVSFWPISPYKIPKSKPYAAIGQFLR